MPQEELDAASFSSDTCDFLVALHRHGVRYLVVGGEAVIYYGYARVTGDIDLFYERTAENAQRLYAALREFWQGNVPGVQGEGDLVEPGVIVQFGVPPNRIDLVNRIDGVDFEAAWPNRLGVHVLGESFDIVVWFLSLEDLVRNKRAAARPKDLDDLRFLEKQV